ncbi:MAG: LysE family transporter [Dehalococcoidia bacterium]
MDLIQLGLISFGIGISGAVSPGPLTIVTIQQSIKNGFFVGPVMAIGHSILEIFVVLFLALGLVNFAQDNQVVENIIGVVGGVVLLVMGRGLILLKTDEGLLSLASDPTVQSDSSILTKYKIWINLGWLSVVVSVTNPYFIIWWLTIGAKIINDGLGSGPIGVSAVYFGHIMADFAWMILLSIIFSSGKNWITLKIQNIINRVCGFLLVCFGIYFLYSPIVTYLT